MRVIQFFIFAAWLCVAVSGSIVESVAIEPLTCQARGQPCSTTLDCCIGACSSHRNVCRKCIKLQKHCTSISDCCGTNVCGASNLCIKASATTSSSRNSGGNGVSKSATLTPAVQSWPDALNKTGDDAATIILASDPNLQVYVIPVTFFVSEDYNTNRVRVRTDDQNITVVEIPVIG
jgi:hypothetical protein